MNRLERERELINSGLVDSIKGLYRNSNVSIPEKYYLLIADYIDSIGQVSESMMIDPVELAQRLPNVLKKIEEKNLGGIHGITDKNTITMNQNLDYEQNKLYFFHELTHALQTYSLDNVEQCAFYNGKTGMFLTEASTQYTAEILYNVSNGTNINYRNQPSSVRGQRNHTPYSPLSEYQFNGDILMLMSMTMDLPLPQVLSLAYKQNGRETLKQIYESMNGNNGKFEELMFDLEKIYSIDKLIMSGYEQQLNTNTPIQISLMGGAGNFDGNLQIQNNTMIKVQREMAASFIANHDEKYILQNYNKILPYLTTQELKQNFMNAIKEISTLVQTDTYEQTNNRGRTMGFINILSITLIIIVVGILIGISLIKIS
ncbi:MAG: hypothetical protein IJO32_07930 [Bacilli bacterium]|nr:hypothetical protein [Bacilli bacterium]